MHAIAWAPIPQSCKATERKPVAVLRGMEGKRHFGTGVQHILGPRRAGERPTGRAMIGMEMGNDDKADIGHILEVGHGSVLEHAAWNMIFTGVSRSLTHELVRHRAGWAYSQLSQRYVDESVAEYVEPDCIAADRCVVVCDG